MPNFEPQWTKFLDKIHRKAIDDTRELWYNEINKICKDLVKEEKITENQADLLLKRIKNHGE